MPVEFLSDAKAAGYGRNAGPPARADLDRVFHLDEADFVLIGRRRGEHMKLGSALQLGAFCGSRDGSAVAPPVFSSGHGIGRRGR
ncbi:DUF4158 domain-containing protein [Nonomuraea endophytica]|uniref:DUF4158 domain-containing protein n=1 Tax=Nonomuraea endophytica TaxID=714136 RepID=A0A7W8EHN1_9ACTN|nr:DUF4158 domain-containing protein [Nonomuraea endophytica]MBB5079764.1 hypothetical protein [Nonomuraea endophytica]